MTTPEPASASLQWKQLTQDWEQMSPRYYRVIYARLLFEALLLAAIFMAIVYWLPEVHVHLLLIRTGMITLMAGRFISAYGRTRHFRYKLDERGIYVQSGFLTRRLRSSTYQRIQNCTIRSTFFERMFGLASLHVYTAGPQEGDLLIKGITTAAAHQLKETVLNRLSHPYDQEPL